MFSYRIAEPGSADLDRWYRLRTDLYLSSGLIAPDDVEAASGVYRDVYDEYSTFILAADHAGVDIGCCRMIEGSAGRPLPVQDLFGIEPLPHSYEGSGVAVAPEHRKGLVSLGLYRAMAALADERGYEYAYSIVEPPYLAFLCELGYPYEALSEPRTVFNAPNVAGVIRRSDTMAAMEAAEGPFAAILLRYYRKPFDWTLTQPDLEPVS